MHEALVAMREKVDKRTQAASAKAKLQRQQSLVGDTRFGHARDVNIPHVHLNVTCMSQLITAPC